MSAFTHAFSHHPHHQRGLLRQVALLVSGRGIVVPKQDLSEMSGHDFIESNAAHRDHVDRSIAEFERGEAKEHAIR